MKLNPEWYTLSDDRLLRYLNHPDITIDQREQIEAELAERDDARAARQERMAEEYFERRLMGGEV